MDMVERVARVIGEAYDGYADPIETPNNWARAMSAARAAIEAMREPTDAMLAAADDAWVGADRAPPEIEYRMMIDAILKKA